MYKINRPKKSIESIFVGTRISPSPYRTYCSDHKSTWNPKWPTIHVYASVFLYFIYKSMFPPQWIANIRQRYPNWLPNYYLLFFGRHYLQSNRNQINIYSDTRSQTDSFVFLHRPVLLTEWKNIFFVLPSQIKCYFRVFEAFGMLWSNCIWCTSIKCNVYAYIGGFSA